MAIEQIDFFDGSVKPKRYKKDAYCGNPGQGPKGQTCKTCKHLISHTMAKKYFKCDLVMWTHGPATDVRVRTPACQFWESNNYG